MKRRRPNPLQQIPNDPVATAQILYRKFGVQALGWAKTAMELERNHRFWSNVCEILRAGLRHGGDRYAMWKATQTNPRKRAKKRSNRGRRPRR